MNNGIVIVNYNDYKTTKELLDNIKDYKCLDKIIVVDNKSSDDSLKKLNDLKYDKVEIIDSGKNLGYSYGLNVGCKYLIEKYNIKKIAISNSDIIISNESDLIDLFNHISSKNVIVAPSIITGNDVSRGWHLPTYIDDLISNIPILHQKYYEKKLMYPSNYYYKDISKVEAVSGCFFIIDANYLKSINYFDDNIFLYYEENILGKITKNNNKNIIVCNNIDVIHNHSVTIDKALKKIKKYDALKKSQMYYEKKYNNIGILRQFILWLSIKITRIILYIVYLIRG